PFINSVLEGSDNLHLIASNVNKNSFKVREDMKMYATIPAGGKDYRDARVGALQSGSGSPPEAMDSLKKRKKELEVDICSDMFKMINRNRLL
ncbi:hypothetical protein A2U01_0079097, partial [Trifolium medium]|nr:hypothetical protein [Trifolium medium]